MSDNDMIRRGRMREEINKLSFNPLVNELLYKVLDTIPCEQVAAPHEMTAREYMRIFARLCHGNEVHCSECPLNAQGRCLHKVYGGGDMAVSAAEQWAAEHPEKRKTYAEDFKERFPNVSPIVFVDYCRDFFYGSTNLQKDCDHNCTACWNEEMEERDE